MCEQTPGGGDDHIGTHLQSTLLTGEFLAVSAAVDSHARHWQEVGESLHLTVDLLGKLACGCHDYAVDSVLRVLVFGKFVYDRQQIGGGLAGAGLGYREQIASLKHDRYGAFLYGCALREIHVIEGVEDTVAEVSLIKSHSYECVWRSVSPTALLLFRNYICLSVARFSISMQSYAFCVSPANQ